MIVQLTLFCLIYVFASHYFDYDAFTRHALAYTYWTPLISHSPKRSWLN